MTKYKKLEEYLKDHQKTWLITGVAGFIGSNLLEKLLILNQKVVGLDSFETGYQHNIDEAIQDANNITGKDKSDNFKFIKGDIRSLGGNRYKWNEVTNVDVTAVELDLECARLYQDRFPNDKVIVTDAHKYLLDHYKEFDFIWSSPPCPSHSRINVSQKTRDVWKPRYPDMKLYEEIIFLQHYFLYIL